MPTTRRPLPALPAILLTAALTLGACQTGPDETASANLLPAEGGVWQGQRSQAAERAYVVARTPQEWEELWARVGAPAPGSLPADRMAVALFLGTRDTAGFGVSIDSARQKGDEIVIGYREQVPGPTQTVAQVQTSPYAIRLLPRLDGHAIFERQN
jgi:hypothetical protein